MARYSGSASREELEEEFGMFQLFVRLLGGSAELEPREEELSRVWGLDEVSMDEISLMGRRF